MASAKEKCFQNALDAWEKATGRNLKIDFEQPWIKNADGIWERGNRSWWALVNSWRKTKRFLSGGGGEPGEVQGLRRPDITMPGENGKDRIVELKFTDANGNPDPWRPGQEEDYGEINQQTQGGTEGATKLDKDTCKCEGEPQPEVVEDPLGAAAPENLPYRLPRSMQRSPGGVRVPGIRIPVPVIP